LAATAKKKSKRKQTEGRVRTALVCMDNTTVQRSQQLGRLVMTHSAGNSVELVDRTKISTAGSEAITAVVMNITIFRGIAPCSPYVTRRFGGTFYFHLQEKNHPSKKPACSRWLIFDPEHGGDDRSCDVVVRVLGYRSGGPGSIPGTTKKKSSGSGTGSTQPREYN
jgi:hypothetical protein